MICHHCQKQVLLEDKRRLSPQEECPHCQSYLHCCLNCRFYDPGRPNRCFEPQAERVIDKEQANYCAYFTPAHEAKDSTQKAAKEEALKHFNALFKKEGDNGC